MSMVWTRAWFVWALAALFIVGCGGRRPVPTGLRPTEEVQGIYHVMEKGQTLWRVCKAYGADLQQVAEINNIQDFTDIKTGQRIFIPGASRPLEVEPYRPPPPGSPPEAPEPKVATFHGRFIWPVRGTVTSPFGVRDGIKHSGLDISAPEGSPVVAAAGGEVVYAGNLRGYGRILILKHNHKYTTVYAHLRSRHVQMHETVRQGQVIATVGNSGRSSGPHLHFEVRAFNISRNPMFYLPKDSD
jgi:lipoprotein NlpD